MIDPDSGVPLHAQVAASIRSAIDAGELTPGDYLRAERDLEGDFGVGRATIRSALESLAAEGRIVRRRGYRAQVMPTQQRTEVKIQRGSRLRTRMPTPAERREWRLPGGVPVVEVHYGGRVQVYPGDRCDFTAS